MHLGMTMPPSFDILLLFFLKAFERLLGRVGNRSDRVGFPPWTDPTEAISVLEIFQTDPGIFRSGLSQV